MELKKSADRYHNASKSLLSQAIDFLPDPTFAVDLTGRVLIWNRAMEAITHIKAEDIVGRGDYEYSVPFYGERRPILIDMVLHNDAELEKRYDFIRREGNNLYATEAVGLPSKKFLLGKAGPIYGDDGLMIGAIESIQDITERKETEETLRESEGIFRVLFNQSYHLIGLMKIDGTLIKANYTALEFTGIQESDVMGRLFWETPWWSHSEEQKEHLRNAVIEAAKGHFVRFEASHLDAEGRTHIIDFSIKPVKNENSNVMLLISEGRDITERKQAEEKLHQSEEKFSKIFMMTPDCIVISRMTDGLIIDANIGFEEITGWKRSEIIGRTTLSTNVWRNPADRALMVSDLEEGRDIMQREFHFRRKDGSLGIGIYSARSIHIADEAFILFVMQDITDRKRLEEDRQKLEQQLFQSQKMEALGTLAGGIAHDFNNILTPIIGFAELTMNDSPKESRTHDNLAEIHAAAIRAKDLVSQILTFSRKTENAYSPLALHTIIKESLKLLRSVTPSTIEIRQRLADSGLVMSNPTQVHQIIMNLCTNALHAMDEAGGVMEVSLKKVNLDQETAAAFGITPGSYLRLMISDTGHGMPPEVMNRIFEPYFTTKEPGRGTGLGLSMVHGIVESHNGAITCRSVPKEGTTFEVYFPEIESGKKAEGPSEEEPFPTGKEHILFIDDETAVTHLAEELLSKLGYKVTPKTSSVDAFDSFKEKPYEFDLVITDMTMPVMTGDSIAQRIMEIRPDIPVILCTGYSEHISEDRAKMIGIRDFVMKPFEINVLAKTIRKVLDGL